MKILRASEDYLEAMLMMQEKHGYIRSIDVAEHLGVTKPSVTYTTKRLRESGYITMDRDGLITLTESGMEIASKMLDRHHTLTQLPRRHRRRPEDGGAGCLPGSSTISASRPMTPCAPTPSVRPTRASPGLTR